MHVLQAPAETQGTAESPEWVADWWIPAPDRAEPEPDVEMSTLLGPEPVVRIEVAGRPLLPVTATR